MWVIVCLLLSTVAFTVSTPTPNVIFAMADDLGWGDVQYNGGKAFTPNLNEMARSDNAILLQRHYSGSPVCSPTRATLLTGRNHNRYCVWSVNSARGDKSDFSTAQTMPLPLSEITVAEIMRNAGYSTAFFGKWHLGDFKPLRGGNSKWPVSHPGLHGFEQWWATGRSAPTTTTNCGCFQNSVCTLGHYTNRPVCTNYYTNTSDDTVGWSQPIPGDDSHFIWSLAEKYIREQVNFHKPFFLYLPFHSVHSRFVATDQYRNFYLKARGHVHSKHVTKETLSKADYYGAISAMDNVIGKLRNLLQELGIKNNTLFWFTSDNGPTKDGSTNGLRGLKTSLYEGGVRVPGIIEWPDVISSNRVSQFPVVSSDLLPTVQDILDVKPSDDRPIDGISILPFLQGKEEKRNQSIFWAFNIRKGDFSSSYNISTMKDKYKLIVTYHHNTIQHYELYDLKKDIRESRNLKDIHPNIASRLLNQIKTWRNSVIQSTNDVGCVLNT
ncbi:N-acetylgalactosamine-6-sulfatase-like [Dysidea avara]|uniref:N-acetylgalactosamine-6-sulfatase-like n=1 Tax=Dysidea avara TaxID=196820 RepID=UPI003316B11D